MRRRNFITLLGGTVLLSTHTTPGQQRLPTIGFLVSGAAASFAVFVDAFKDGMRENGMIEARDYLLDLRFAEGDL